MRDTCVPPVRTRTMDLKSIENYLHEHIPLSRAMGVTVVSVEPDSVELSAPLEPNINHRETVFGGSASALAILSAWTLVHARLDKEGMHSRVVIQENTMSYLRPFTDRFAAVANLSPTSDWNRFVMTLRRKGRARIDVQAGLYCGGGKVGDFQGRFVALAIESARLQ
jgi:thioesterase domain-containing protein